MNSKVSVIVPVYNDPDGIRKLLAALVEQSYPKQLYEIIVVDNGSTDGTLDAAKKYQDAYPDLIRVLVEDSVQSSYAARNMGVQASHGEIVAMIDADCTPIPEWIERGVHALETQEADLVGGKVTFVFSSKPDPAELYDAMTNIQMKRDIDLRGVAKTANLFARRTVFNEIHYFPAHLKSGGDVIWTGEATNAGFVLIYSSKAEVFHPTRKLEALLRKQYRVGGGQLAIWKSQGCGFLYILKVLITGFFPANPWRIRKLIREFEGLEMQKGLGVLVWLVAWLCKLATSLGRIRALVL